MDFIANSPFIIDIVILIVLAICAFLGYRKGFILTLASFLAVFIAFFGATYLSDLLCEPAASLLQPAVESVVTKAIESAAPDGLLTPSEQPLDPAVATLLPPDPDENEPTEILVSIDQILEALEGLSLFDQYINFDGFLQSFRDTIDSSIQQSIAATGREISLYIARELARAILFLVCFLLILALWSLVSHMLDLAFKLPVLSTVNAVSGLLLGLVKGLCLVFIVVFLVKSALLTPEFTKRTFLLRFFAETNPFALISQLILTSGS